jgi:hypothetical protein
LKILVHYLAPFEDFLKVPAFIVYGVFVAHGCFCVVAVDGCDVGKKVVDVVPRELASF